MENLVFISIALALISIVSGPLGCILLWRRMAFFGDALSHAILFGMSLSIIFKIDMMLGTFIFAIFFAFFLFYFTKSNKSSADTILAIFAHSGIAITLFLGAFYDDVSIELEHMLFGDIEDISKQQLIYLSIGSCISFIWLYKIWKKLLIITINSDLAQVEKINVNSVNMQFAFILSILIVILIHTSGSLLATAMMILPSAVARHISKTPDKMAINSIIVGIICSTVGIITSNYFNCPVGPTIVLSFLASFIALETRSKFH